MKVNIIGAGVAGLAAGIYLQKNGIQTEIFEQHTVAGGLCAGWRRGDYLINGCMHWLLGSHEGISFNTFWREIIDLDSIEFKYHEERVVFDVPGLQDRYGNTVFHFYNDIDVFEKYLLDIAPEDESSIRLWMNQVRFVGKYLDRLPPVFYDEPWWKGLLHKMQLSSLFPMLFFMLRWRKLTNWQFAERFKNPFLRKAIVLLYEKEMPLTILFFVQSYANEGVAGYPQGGSLPFAQKLTESYLQKGGKLRLGTEVERIEVENGKAKALRLKDGTLEACDYVVSAGDWNWTIFSALGGRYLSKGQEQLRVPKKEQIFYSFCILYLGVDYDMGNLPHFIRYDMGEKFQSPDGTEYERLEVHIYNYDSSMAPSGKSLLAIDFQTREGDYWISLRQNDYEEYKRQKRQFEQKVISLLSRKLGDDFPSHVEMSDMTTPATYYRYTRNYRGSSQGWTPQNNVLLRLPISNRVEGVDNLYLAGHWMEAGGGLPIALKSARDTAWALSKRIKGKFVV
ncbi:MAG: NAD(P)/FAD-dependent oxidoreductase [Paludibacteraceae bacterium]|nr:NAD(P)/FAD-dependent oxidoreductase [Paludibacteraceae bacterium]